MSDVESRLRELGAQRRSMGARLIEPDIDSRLRWAAKQIVAFMYARGDFGEGDRSEEWLAGKVEDLGSCLQGTLEDWQYTK